MSGRFHDDWLRRTPAELLVPVQEDVRERFARIRSEAEQTGVSTTDPLRFPALGGVQRLLEDVQPAGAAPESAYLYGVLAWYCFRAWAESAGPLLLTELGARALVRRSAPVDAAPPPSPAGYVQLPRHLFWVRPDAEEPAEPVDGLYWEIRAGDLGALIVSGLREGRPGFGVVVAPPVALTDLAAASGAEVRPDGPAFASALPGGAESGLLSLETAGEVYALLARLFAHLAERPEDLSARLDPATGESPSASRFPYRRVTAPGPPES